MSKSNYWSSSFYLTPYAEWKVFLWAIAKSQFGIEDCQFAWQKPWRIRWWGKRWRIQLRSAVQLHLPTYLIVECGERVVGVKDWDIPF